MLTAPIIHSFVEKVLLSRFDEPKPIPRCHDEWWELVCDPHPYVAIAAPRGHAKTTGITHSYALASVAFREANHVMILSDTESQGQMFLGDIKDEFLENEDFIELFQFDRFTKDNEKEIRGRFKDGHQFRIFVRGSEQKLRGTKWKNKRPDLVICDDLENDEIVLSDDRRRKFKEWFFKAVVPCLSDNGKIRFVGTILHFDSALENLMPEWERDDTHTDGLKWWSTKPNRDWKAVRYQAHNEEFTQFLWPEKFSKEKLMWLKEMYKRQGIPEGYAQEYLNYPISVEDAYYKTQDFNPIRDREEPLEYYTGVDLAISEKKGSAFSAFVTVGVNSTGISKVVDVLRFRGDSLKICDSFFSVHSRYRPVFIVESENIERSIGPFLNKKMMESGIFLNIEKIISSKDKEFRGRSWQARMRVGAVQIDEDAEWYSDYRTEKLAFPKTKYKDQVDATHNVGLYLADMFEGPTAQELEDMEYEEEKEDTYDFFGPMGEPDFVTGY